MKLLITGSRKFEDMNALIQAIKEVESRQGENITIVLHGGAKGTDSLAQK